MAIFYLVAALTLSASVSVPVSFTAGLATPARSTLVANPNSATADGTATVLLTLKAYDAYNNATPGINVNLAASGANNAFGATSGVTDPNGQFITTLKSTLAQSKTVTATFGNSNTLTTTVAFVSGPASATTSSVVVNPNSTIADNNSTLTALLTLRDVQGNPIAGAVPSFSASGSSTTVTPSGNTSASGQASATYKTALAQGQNALVTVAGLSLAAPMSFSAGPAAAATSTLTASPNSVAGNGTASISLVTSVKDAQGNSVSGASVVLTASGGNTTFGAASGTTLTSGAYTTTLKSTKMQTETITARIAGNFNETVSVTFTGSPNAVTSTLAVSPNSQTVGPANLINATLTLRDAAANPLSGVTPSWTATGSKNTISVSGATSSAGMATATYASTLAQNENVQVGAGGVNLYQPVTFVAGPPSAVTSYMYAIPARQLANNSNTLAVSLMLFDAYSNVLAGQTATFAASGSNTTVSGTAITDSTGFAQATYRTPTIQNQNALATVGSMTLSLPIIFTGVPAKCSLSINPNSQPADGNSSLGLTATVSDNSNQPIPGVQVIFSSTGAAQRFSPQNVVTSAAGTALSSLKSLYAGTNTILAQAANVQCTSQGNYLTRTPYCPANPNYNTASYTAGSYPFGIAIADFNGDGKPDVAITNAISGTLGVFIATGTSSFQGEITYAAGSFPIGVTAGDFNGDGAQDLAVTNYSSDTFGVFIGTGTGAFQSQVTYATDSEPQSITVSDYNGDGRQDLAVANRSSNSISIFIGTGTGTFQSALTTPTGSLPQYITTSDFNNDGKQDLAVTLSDSDSVGIFLGTGSGTFQPQVTYSTGSYPKGITTGDYNGDGKRDLALTNYNSDTFSVLLGTGTGSFQTQVTYATDSAPQDIATGDFNGDGKQDLAVINNTSDTLGIYLGTGNGTFQPEVTFATDSDPQGIAIADLNGDGKLDIAVTNVGGTLGVYYTFCP
jgi:hypothetical protein